MINRFNLRKAFNDYIKANLKSGFEYAKSVDSYTPKPNTPYVDMSVTVGQPNISLTPGDQEDALGFCQIDVRSPHSFNWFGHEANVDHYVGLFDKGPNTVAQISDQTVVITAVATSNSFKEETHFVSAITVNFRVIG